MDFLYDIYFQFAGMKNNMISSSEVYDVDDVSSYVLCDANGNIFILIDYIGANMYNGTYVDVMYYGDYSKLITQINNSKKSLFLFKLTEKDKVSYEFFENYDEKIIKNAENFTNFIKNNK